MLELLIVIVIIGLLASVVYLTSMMGVKQSRDTRRIQELYQVAQSLQLYYSTYHEYPENDDLDDPGCNIHGVAWDGGNVAFGAGDDFVKPIKDEKFMGILPKEWTDVKDAWGSQCIYRYSKMENPCDGQCEGVYAILYGACESPNCPEGERPACCNGSSWGEGAGENDKYDISIFLQQR